MGILMQNEIDYGNLFDTVRHVAQAYRGKPHDYSDVVAYIHDDTDIPHYPVPAIRVVRDIEFQYDRTIAWYVYPGGHWGFRYLATR